MHIRGAGLEAALEERPFRDESAAGKLAREFGA